MSDDTLDAAEHRNLNIQFYNMLIDRMDAYHTNNIEHMTAYHAENIDSLEEITNALVNIENALNKTNDLLRRLLLNFPNG